VDGIEGMSERDITALLPVRHDDRVRD
jgi:hypothetical protein